MTPTGIKERVVAERAAWIEEMLRGVGALPLESYEQFIGDPRNVAAADSYVRRALEALMDLGRHILAKGLGRVATEYRDVPRQLLAGGVIDEETSQRLSTFRDIILRLVKESDSAVLAVDALRLLGNEDYRPEDVIHPTKAGHNKLAAALFEALCPDPPSCKSLEPSEPAALKPRIRGGQILLIGGSVSVSAGDGRVSYVDRISARLIGSSTRQRARFADCS